MGLYFLKIIMKYIFDLELFYSLFRISIYLVMRLPDIFIFSRLPLWILHCHHLWMNLWRIQKILSVMSGARPLGIAQCWWKLWMSEGQSYILSLRTNIIFFKNASHWLLSYGFSWSPVWWVDSEEDCEVCFNVERVLGSTNFWKHTPMRCCWLLQDHKTSNSLQSHWWLPGRLRIVRWLIQC
jgi:hypothetical protein